MRTTPVAAAKRWGAALVALLVTQGCDSKQPLTVVEHAVDRVEVVSSMTTIPTEATLQLQAEAICAHDGGHVLDVPITWSSQAPEVATVSESGLVTGLTVGDATITAAAEGETGGMDITVTASVVSVEVKAPTSVLYIGKSITLVVVLLDKEGKEIQRGRKFLSSHSDVADVTHEGVVTGLTAGKVTITVSSEGTEATIEITVLAPIATLEVLPETATIMIGETETLTATAKDADGNTLNRPVTWESSDDGIATVDADGIVTGIAAGKATVTASSEVVPGAATVSGAAEITVLAPVATVAVDPPASSILPAATVQLTATLKDADGNVLNRPVDWSGNADAIATVDANGLVTSVAPGTATITATSEGQIGTATVEVLVPIDRITITDPGMEPLEIGLTKQLTATVWDAVGNVLNRPVDWSSSDDNLATVDATGLVTGVGRGTVNITASAEGKSASVQLRVVGEDTGTGNNLSYPVVFGEGIGLTGLEVSDAVGDPVPLNTGLRPTVDENIPVTALPFFHSGNVPDYGAYHEQQGSNVWQAEWADGVPLGERSTEAAWGDNLTHQTWNTHSMIRVEVVLSDLGIGTLTGYEMEYLYGSGPDEMQGTLGTEVEYVPTIYAITPRLIIEKLDAAGVDVVEEVFNGAIWEGLGGHGDFTAEVNVGGKVIYGYNLFIRNIVLQTVGAHKYGWWRLKLVLDDNATVGTATVPRNEQLDAVVGENDASLTYQPKLDKTTNTTWLDIWVDKG